MRAWMTLIVMWAATAGAAGVKISDLPAASSVSTSDVVPVVAGGETKRATVGQIGDAVKLGLVSEAGSQVTVAGSLVVDSGSATVLLQNGAVTADEIYGLVFASGLSLDSGQPLSMDNGDIEGARTIDAQTIYASGDLFLSGELDAQSLVSSSTGPVEIGDDLNVSGSVGVGGGDKIEFYGLGGGGPTISSGIAAPTTVTATA